MNGSTLYDDECGGDGEGILRPSIYCIQLGDTRETTAMINQNEHHGMHVQTNESYKHPHVDCLIL